MSHNPNNGKAVVVLMGLLLAMAVYVYGCTAQAYGEAKARVESVSAE
jgi:hypothetical protein